MAHRALRQAAAAAGGAVFHLGELTRALRPRTRGSASSVQSLLVFLASGPSARLVQRIEVINVPHAAVHLHRCAVAERKMTADPMLSQAVEMAWRAIMPVFREMGTERHASRWNVQPTLPSPNLEVRIRSLPIPHPKPSAFRL